MAVHLVSPSIDIDMIGPYLAARATCPCRGKVNTFVRVEGPISAVKPIDVCGHIRAHIIDEECESKFEFEGELSESK